MVLPLGFTGARLDRADQMRTNEAAFAAAIADPRATCLTLDGIDFVPGASGGLVWEPLDPADERALMLLGIDDAGAPRFVREAAAGGRIDARSRKIGRASGRERVCQYVSISGVAVSLKKQRNIIMNKRQHYT